MHEISVESNAFTLRLVCHGIEVKQLAAADPATGELMPLENET